jgi:hypothetical protein
MLAANRALHIRVRQISLGSSPLRPWILDSFRYSSFLREWLNARRRWYSDELLNILATAEGERSRATAQPSAISAERQ